MQLHLLQTVDLPPRPESIRVLHDFESLLVYTGTYGEPYDPTKEVEGQNIIIECTEDQLYEWLGKVDGFWKGVGNPMLEHFEVKHLKEREGTS